MDYGVPQQSFDPNFMINETMFFIMFWIGLVILFFWGVKEIIKAIAKSQKYFDHVIYSVRLPKEKPGEKEEEKTLQKLREEIAKGETVFASIGGLRAQRGFLPWLIGRTDHFSFEIVASQKLISFYVAAPREMARYLEQQIQAHYPDAVMEEVEDYNIFHPQSEIASGYMKTKREFIFPLKTYNKMEVDPVNSVLNVMSKLEYEESMAVQFVVRSAKGKWHKRAIKVVRKSHEMNSVKMGLRYKGINSFFINLMDLLKTAKPPAPNSLAAKRQLTSQEQEILKTIEEKNAKAGLDVNLRIVVSAKTGAKAKNYLNNMASVFSQYNYYEYGNSFNNQIYSRSRNKLISDFIYRRFDRKIDFLLNTEELDSLFHFPLPNAETPNILWLTAKHAPAPTNIPDEGIILGRNIYRGIAKDIKIKREDRRRHTYIIGKSGVGKSQLLASMAIQDITNGEGVCVIDPHGDLINDILSRIPPERAEDVILFSPADIERPLALNLLEFDARYPEQKTFVINEMIKIFDKLYDLKATGGPIFEQYMRNAMLLVMADPESGSTLMEIPKVLSDPDFRKMKLAKCSDPTVVDFWKKEAEKAGGDAALANIVPYITSKLTTFISNDTMRPIIGQQNSSFNLRDIMDNKKILLVDLTKGLIGEMNSYLLGMILVGKILMAALSRAGLPPEERKDFYLYIDEFQNFITDSICSILSEARKYNLNLIIAHQYLGQLIIHGKDNTIRDAVFGNVGTWLLFKVGSEDAEIMAKEFAPVFNQYDLINIDKFTTYVKLLIDNSASRPFSMATLWPLPGIKREDMAGRIRALSRLKFGQDRNIIEAEIRKRWEE